MAKENTNGAAELKTGLFGIGYSKKSVCEYIAYLNRGYEERLAEKLGEKEAEYEKASAEAEEKCESLRGENSTLSEENEELRTEVSELREKCASLEDGGKSLSEKLALLEEEVASLEKENASLRKKSDDVADILADAKNFANMLRAKASEENEEYRRANRERNDAERARLEAYGHKVDRIRSDVVTMLRGMEMSLGEMTAGISKLLGDDELPKY